MPVLPFLLFLFPAPSLSADCPGGSFTAVGSKRLYWSASPGDYDAAMASCSALGEVTPAVFLDPAEMAAIQNKGVAGEQLLGVLVNCLSVKVLLNSPPIQYSENGIDSF